VHAGRRRQQDTESDVLPDQRALLFVERGNQTRPAFHVPAASGAKYEGQDVMFWEVRGEATVTWLGVELKCKPRYSH
jgi:membrane-bound inhibitor of C-type lysozyme